MDIHAHTPLEYTRQQEPGAEFGEADNSATEIAVPQTLAELLLRQAAQREVSLEEIVTHAFKNQLGRSENDGW